MKSQTPAGNVAVAATQSNATDSTVPSPFQQSEASSGLRLQDPSTQLSEEPSTDVPSPSTLRLQTEPEVMLCMLSAQIGGS
jgi:hypothetical protein